MIIVRYPVDRKGKQNSMLDKLSGGGGVRGRLEVFRKFIEFGTGNAPKVQVQSVIELFGRKVNNGLNVHKITNT